ncbi:MAG: RdgB/HAM1 family non-canonical purine NTP pyrophosphatase [Vicinamibacterales bacterium]
MRLLVATTNPGKLREIRPLLAGVDVELVTLADLAPIPEPAETGATFWENARQKALAYAAASGLTTVAEDSGLEIGALGGEPGVRSARFLRDDASYAERFAAIFGRLAGVEADGRRARFVTALAVARAGTLLFETEASVEGRIAQHPAGDGGFGYDPIFLYPPFGRTTAELTPAEKAAVSHRARAFRDFVRWLRAESHA